MIVKFSPPKTNDIAVRVADLLIYEHLALGLLAAIGQRAATSSLLEAEDRVFLEVERFDRTAVGGRRGLYSLACLDAEFVGDASNSWSASVAALVAQKRVPREALQTTRWLELFSN